MSLQSRIFLFFSLSFLLLQHVCAKDAFIIIDMQPVFITRNSYDEILDNRQKVETILERQIVAIKKAKEAGIPIVVVEYVHKSLGNSSTHEKLVEALKGYDFFLFKKTGDGAFDGSNVLDLKKYLMENDVDNLIVAGANGGACVKATISGAIKCGYKVIAVDDLIADFNFKSFIYPYKGGYDDFNQLPQFRESSCYNSVFLAGLEKANKSLDDLGGLLKNK